MIGFCPELREDGNPEEAEENHRAERIAEFHRHGQSIAAGLAKRGGSNLDDPERQSDFRNLARWMSGSR